MRCFRALIPLALVACSPPARVATGSPLLSTPVLAEQQSGTAALLQAVSPVTDEIVWVSGHRGTFARTLDGGETWQAEQVAGADTLQFRDVHGVSADVAYLMSAGSGALSRIYKTTDGGRSWMLQHTNTEPDGFFDCFAFWDADRGVVFSDAVGGTHLLLATSDGGAHWTRVGPTGLPPALAGEGSFAASGTCAATIGGAHAWIGTGNASPARVLRSRDGGRSWSAATVPVASGEAAGLASVIFRDSVHGVALGGEIGRPDARGDYVARTADGGARWTPGGRPTFAGAVYGASYVPGAATPTIVAVGPGGVDLSADDGRSWRSVGTTGAWSVAFGTSGVGWIVGPRGRITRVRVY
jgi:photosystem II stability/assembly factor-like uncharacterized protein